MAIAFEKMHGCGNDFVVLDARRGPIELSDAQIRRIGDRHRGVGFDQLALLGPSADGDVGIRFFNADGSEAGACGNATRCVARLLFDEGATGRLVLMVGDRRLLADLLPDGRISVAMGVPGLDWRQIPLAEPCDTLAVPIGEPGLPPAVAVDMGNPHAVFFVDRLDGLDVGALGARLEHHPMFPERANIGFARQIGPDMLRLRVFERGAGLTLACGSGACAAMVAAHRRGLVGDRARLLLDGGELECIWAGEGAVTMIGPTAKAFSGMLSDELLDDAG